MSVESYNCQFIPSKFSPLDFLAALRVYSRFGNHFGKTINHKIHIQKPLLQYKLSTFRPAAICKTDRAEGRKRLWMRSDGKELHEKAEREQTAFCSAHNRVAFLCSRIKNTDIECTIEPLFSQKYKHYFCMNALWVV